MKYCFAAVGLQPCLLSAKTLTRGAAVVVIGLTAACGSDDSASSNGTAEVDGEPVTVATVQADPVESDSVNSDPFDADSENQTELVSPQNDGNNADTDSQQASTTSETGGSDSVQSIADNQRVNFGAAKLLVDLTPNGASYPANFHLVDDKLYFWTVDTDPRIAECASHWGGLSDADKDISFNLVATHRQTDVVKMNKKMMTLGDFAEDLNYVCQGYNGKIMGAFDPSWMTSTSSSSEQQFVVHFDNRLGPEMVWKTDGSDANTILLGTGQIEEQSIFKGDKVFFWNAGGLSVSDTFFGDRRKLFDMDGTYQYGSIRQVVRSPERQVTFEINVADKRYQIWTYDLDTDEWEKKFTIKLDNATYDHYETLLVDGQTLLSSGNDNIKNETALGYSSHYGDITSFNIVSDSAPSISNSDPFGADYSPGVGADNSLVYSTTDYSSEPPATSIWSYSDERIENLFSIVEPGLKGISVIAGQDGYFYVAGIKLQGQGSEHNRSLELWSYNPQNGQLVELSEDDWFALIYDYPSIDEGYVFRYLNTPDGLIFINLTEDSGRELWYTNGTPQGTLQLTDINPGTGDSDPLNFYYSGDAIYFSADDGTHDREPWMIPILR